MGWNAQCGLACFPRRAKRGAQVHPIEPLTDPPSIFARLASALSRKLSGRCVRLTRDGYPTLTNRSLTDFQGRRMLPGAPGPCSLSDGCGVHAKRPFCSWSSSGGVGHLIEIKHYEGRQTRPMMTSCLADVLVDVLADVLAALLTAMRSCSLATNAASPLQSRRVFHESTANQCGRNTPRQVDPPAHNIQPLAPLPAGRPIGAASKPVTEPPIFIETGGQTSSQPLRSSQLPDLFRTCRPSS